MGVVPAWFQPGSRERRYDIARAERTERRDRSRQTAVDEAADQDIAQQPDTADRFNPRAAAVIAGAHFSHDLYPAFIGVLIPAVQEKLGISLAVASLMVPADQLPSMVQPVVGVIADRTSRRWYVVLAPALSAICFSLIGLAPHVAIVLLLLIAAGFVSAGFHPPAIALVTEYGGSRLGRAVAIFMAGGDLARSLGPLVITAAIALFTLEGSVVVVVFGLVASLLLYLTLDTREIDAETRSRARVRIGPILRARLRPIAAVISYSIIIGMTSTPFQYFLVKLLETRGRGGWYSGAALTIFSAAGVLGGLLGGSLSDRLGRRTLMMLCSLTSAPLFYLYLLTENGTWFVLGILFLAGMAARSARPVGLAFAQEMLPEARGTMAGITQAIQFVSSSVVAFGFGALADAISIQTAFWWAAGISLLGLLLVPFLPNPSKPLAQPKNA